MKPRDDWTIWKQEEYERSPFLAGWECYCDGLSRLANPYQERGEDWARWDNGWLAAKKIGACTPPSRSVE